MNETNDDKEINSKTYFHKEGGWGWIVMLATSYNVGLLVGIVNSYALIYNKMVNTYEHEENHVFYAGNYFYN